MLLVGNFVFAGFTAGQAIIQAVGTETNIHLRLAKHAVFFALAVIFGHVALDAVGLGFGRHEATVARASAR